VYNHFAMSEENPVVEKSILQRMLPGLLLGLLVLIALSLFADVRQLTEVIEKFDWRVYPAALALTFLNYGLRFVKWNFYLDQLHTEKISIKDNLRIFVGGFPLAVTPGKVGEALKGVWLNQISGMPVGRGIAAVVAERISDGIAVLLLSTLGVIAYPQYWPAFVIILAGLILVVILSQIRPAALFLLSIFERIPLVNRIAVGIREFYEGSFSLFRPKATLLGVGLGCISWLGEGIGFYLILRGLGMDAGSRMVSMAVFILSFSTVVGAVSALPGGLGAAEASIAGMLALVVGASPAVAAAATVLIRMATLWFGVLLGLIVWAFSPHMIGLMVDHGTAD
jgi:uncharacterized protein (TIRG00374 family)